MLKKIVFFASIIFFSSNLIAQENDNSIKNQFNGVIEKSNSYQEFKVIEKTKINKLRKNVLDSIAFLEQKIIDANSTIKDQENTITSISNDLKTTQENLTVSKGKEDGMSVFGVTTKKATYNLVLCSIIGALMFFLILLFYRFKNSHSITKQTNLKLSEIEKEFDVHRKKTLEQQQQLSRKLQDEINKSKKS
ncbi:hypothetical protein ABXT64_00445 [Candidatus Marifrigoribacter sp. Uisw_064]|jgi:septal ring factor EnvC (AmiA/AmiB activator)|uniref:hypothetical protein n=1 Tax=Candidatus Marifrigoribacter sp. Uisw_064 TaxID=3230970 RepID=UPI003ADBA6AC